MGWDGTARIAFPMNDNACQNDNELRTLLNFKVNKVNKFCRFLSLFVHVVLSIVRTTLKFLWEFHKIGWDRHELLWNGMG